MNSRRHVNSTVIRLAVKMSIWFSQTIGYAFAVVVGGLATKLVSDRMWECLGWKKHINPDNFRPDVWQPRVTGIVERVLYVATLQVGKGEFIGFWLALKVAGQWSRWTKESEPGGNGPQGRSIYQNFLIGNALSVLYALVGFKLIEWLSSGALARSLVVSLTLVICTTLLWAWISRLPRGV